MTPSDRRIAEAPRAWVVGWLNSAEIGCFMRFEKGEALALSRRLIAAEGGEWRVVPVALVELKPEEAG